MDNLGQDRGMSTDISAQMCFAGNPQQVFTMMSDARYLALKCATAESSEFTVTTDQGEKVITISRVIDVNLPDIARGFLGTPLTINEVQRWAALDSQGCAQATLTITVAGAPAQVSGSLALHPCDVGTCVELTGKVKVSIPLFGSKAEHVIAQEVQHIIAHEESAGNEWLATL